jgi:hypothetical protein
MRHLRVEGNMATRRVRSTIDANVWREGMIRHPLRRRL